ncbi:MAG: DNA topoisomerase IV subunit B [Pelagibacteraceae bacterium TMED136]|nr:MAG: DNA topoisomerase IV subunit B [Pelagibacteraceae bacterium TMED136]OUW02031.1 MAG: DNA topoisomerase IV subunit B [Betaproteobacteria bacterium TMED156]|tara:strand:- start:24768 stop:26708 length:1941 start_codon:yes stop_codon:yes gene_type:complete
MRISKTYSAKDIEVLEGLSPVRKRPGMYIGGTDEAAYHHLANEILDNSIDEAVAGYAKGISVKLINKNTITISDDGRGIPIDKHPKKKKTALEVVMTTLHSGGKFNENIYNSSAGLHGVGLSVVNALSSKLNIKITKNSKIFSQDYSRGKAINKLKLNGKNKIKNGTQITLTPDSEIFGKDLCFKPEIIYELSKNKAYLQKGVRIYWECNKNLLNRKSSIPAKETLLYLNGLEDFIKNEINQNDILHERVCFQTGELNHKKGKMEFALQFNKGKIKFGKAFCNTVFNINGGTHDAGFRSGIAKSIRKYAKNKNNKVVGKATQEDIFDQMAYVISVYISNPEFEGQTKYKLSSAFVQKYCENFSSSTFEEWLNRNTKTAKNIINFLEEKIREKNIYDLNQNVERQNAFRKIRLPGKLSDCTSDKTESTELFIVEGDSAGGSAKQARDRITQAILPLRGKILNVKNSNATKILANSEINNLLQALGCGRGKNYIKKNLRYEKIIIMTDADVDGDHISTLLLTFFICEMPQLIFDGHLYLAVPPLYKLNISGKSKYAIDEKEKNKLLNNNKKANIEISRFKGLGEMMPSQLKETTMNKETRKLIKVIMPTQKARIKKANKFVNDLMGKNPELRLKFISENANKNMNLDV